VDDAADQRVILREADLQHHLSIEEDKNAIEAASKPAVKANDKTEKIIAGPANTKTAAVAKPAGKGDKADAKDAKADGKADPNAKKEDLQLAGRVESPQGPADHRDRDGGDGRDGNVAK
jgi:hypothetical protein